MKTGRVKTLSATSAKLIPDAGKEVDYALYCGYCGLYHDSKAAMSKTRPNVCNFCADYYGLK